MNNFKIKAVAKSVPPKVITNEDLAQIMDTSDEWISQRTGIHERHIAINEGTISMATDVAAQLLAQTGMAAADLDYLIVATMSSDYQTPSTAAAVQGKLKADNAVAFDVNAACTGFVYGSFILSKLLAGQENSTGIIIGAEKLSKFIDWHDRSTAVLFGDGAAGTLVRNEDGTSHIISHNLQTFGQLGKYLTAGHMADVTPFGSAQNQAKPFFQMDGHRVYSFATRKVPASIEKVVSDADLALSDIKYFVLHQANARIIKKVAKQLDQPLAKFPMNIAEYGNTAAASEPLLLTDLVTNGKLERGDKIVLSGFGGGLTCGSLLLEY